MDRHRKSRAKGASGGVVLSKNVSSQTQVMRRKSWGALARIATMKRVIGTTRVTSETKSNVSSGPMSATVFLKLLIRTVPTGRQRNTATRNIATEPRVGSKSEVNKDFDSSDNLKRENPSLEIYEFTGKKRPIEDQTRQVSAKCPQLLTVGKVLQYSNALNIL